MIVNNTPLEHYQQLGLWVKREDLSCPPPGPPFSKTRGVYAHIKNRPEKVIGVLDSYHSQAGHAVATACALLGKQCVNYYPVRKKDGGKPLQPQQKAAKDLGAILIPLQATASWALYHQARKDLAACYEGGYLMPNALKLPETVSETAAEVGRTIFPAGVDTILIAVSSGTIASGVIKGLIDHGWKGRNVVLHMGYNRPIPAVLKYLEDKVGRAIQLDFRITFVNEGYAYKDKATDRRKDIVDPPFPCNPYYDLKLYHWWINEGCAHYHEAILWNIG